MSDMIMVKSDSRHNRTIDEVDEEKQFREVNIQHRDSSIYTLDDRHVGSTRLASHNMRGCQSKAPRGVYMQQKCSRRPTHQPTANSEQQLSAEKSPVEVGRIRREQSEYALRARLVFDATWRCRLTPGGGMAARRSALHVGAPTWSWRVDGPIE